MEVFSFKPHAVYSRGEKKTLAHFGVWAEGRRSDSREVTPKRA